LISFRSPEFRISSHDPLELTFNLCSFWSWFFISDDADILALDPDTGYAFLCFFQTLYIKIGLSIVAPDALNWRLSPTKLIPAGHNPAVHIPNCPRDPTRLVGE
jgi:hypothetical protein